MSLRETTEPDGPALEPSLTTGDRAILKQIYNGVRSQWAIGEALGIEDTSIVRQMLNGLERFHYVHRHIRTPHLWTISAKGERALTPVDVASAAIHEDQMDLTSSADQVAAEIDEPTHHTENTNG